MSAPAGRGHRGRDDYNPEVISQIKACCQRLVRDNRVSPGAVPELRYHAWLNLNHRICLTIPLSAGLIGPENCCEGIASVLYAIIDQACLDALRNVATVGDASRN